jgi:hypothetical protein
VSWLQPEKCQAARGEAEARKEKARQAQPDRYLVEPAAIQGIEINGLTLDGDTRKYLEALQASAMRSFGFGLTSQAPPYMITGGLQISPPPPPGA